MISIDINSIVILDIYCIYYRCILLEYTVLEIQLRSVNYTTVARIFKKFRAKQAVLVVLFKTKIADNRF